MASYFRKLIHKFSVLARPLRDFTKNENTDKKTAAFWDRAPTFVPNVEGLTTAPVLANFDEDKETEVYR